MRTLILRRTVGKRRTERRAGGTRIILPSTAPYTGYPDCPGLDLSELEAHFRLCRTLGEPV